jgi:hypothetical protein
MGKPRCSQEHLNLVKTPLKAIGAGILPVGATSSRDRALVERDEVRVRA